MGSFVAEIIGPAGSGKTSLVHLLKNSDNVKSGLSVWRLPIGLLSITAIETAPAVLRFCVRRKTFSIDDVKLFIQCKALLKVIEKESRKGYRALLLDEGNVFALAKLRAFADNATLSNAESMQALIDELGAKLNAVIWLDAADEVLAARIRTREKSHRVKDATDADIQTHLAKYRSAFEQVIGELTQRQGLKIFRYSTDQTPLEQIAANVLAEARAS